MTTYNLLQRLSAIDQDAQKLISDARSAPCQDPDSPEDWYLHDSVVEMMESLDILHEELRYLRRPVRGEYSLERFADGRYGFYDEDGDPHCFTCGMPIEAKIRSNNGKLHWVRSRIEHDREGYYLWDYEHIPLDGLVVRERG